MNIIIIGAGSIGSQLTKRLSMEKHSITIIEKDPEIAAYASENLDAIVIEGSASSFEVLKKANVENTQVLAALSDVEEVNLFACRIAKKLGVGTTIARIRNPEFLSENYVLRKEEMGVDYMIQPELVAAQTIIRLIKQSNATDIIEFDDGRIELVGIRIEKNAPVVHSALKDLSSKFGDLLMTVVAIKRGQYTVIPKGSDLILAGDQIFIICDPKHLESSLELFGKKDVNVENLMIIGGGMIARFLCKDLAGNYKIKIIESDNRKAQAFSEDYNEPLVIKGDGSDMDLLNFEGLTDMDGFIAITGDDETNIISSLVAKHLTVPRTITLIRKNEYLPLTPTIGLDATVSKQQITVNAIQKFIRRRNVSFFAELPGVDAEVIEFIAKKGSKITSKPLFKTNFPDHAIVGAVLKKDYYLEIPKGNTQIEVDDKVIVFSLPQSIKNVEKLFR